MTQRPVRFEIERPLDFRFTDIRGGVRHAGRTVNISSNGILFRTDQRIGLGRKMEILVRVAKLTPESLEVDLRLLGMAVRSGEGWAAVQVRKRQILPHPRVATLSPGTPAGMSNTNGTHPGPAA